MLHAIVERSQTKRSCSMVKLAPPFETNESRPSAARVNAVRRPPSQKATPTAFGPQGEGAIEGHYTDYKRARLHEHGGLRFGRFVCGVGCNTSSCAAQDLAPLNRQAPPLNE